MNQPTDKEDTTNGSAGGAKTTTPSAGGSELRPPVVVRKSKPCDVLKNLKSVEKKQSKKPTILEQAAQDWTKCKVDEKLEEELKQATKSKSGYLDRQSFLLRSDQRQFEKEREIRDKVRSTRATLK